MAEWSTTSVHETDADPRAIWDRAYADVAAYPRWNPELAEATLDGPFIGSTASPRRTSGSSPRSPPEPGRDEASACQGGTTSVARSSRGGIGDPPER